MSVDFRKPVEIGRPIRAEGWTTTARKRVVDASGRIVDALDGTVLAESHGRYVAASEARKRELSAAYGFRVLPDESSSAELQTPDTPDAVAREAGRPAAEPAP